MTPSTPPPCSLPPHPHILRFCGILATLPQARPGKHFGTSKQRWPPSPSLGPGQRKHMGTSTTHRQLKPTEFDFWWEGLLKTRNFEKEQNMVFKDVSKNHRVDEKLSFCTTTKNGGQVPILTQFARLRRATFFLHFTTFLMQHPGFPRGDFLVITI